MDDISLLRARLDALDSNLHDLLMQRAAVVAQLSAHKQRQGLAGFKPGREAQILRRLLARHTGPLDPGAVVRVWREVFAGSVALQGRFVVATIPDLAALAREQFGAGALVDTLPPDRVLAALAAGEASVGVLPDTGGWLGTLFATSLHIVGKLPFWTQQQGGAPQAGAWMVAATPPDPSGDDISLLLCQGPAPAGQVVASGQGWSLATLPGFGAAAEAALHRFAVPVRAVGAYAVPAG